MAGLERYALAQPIKDVMCALFGWGDSHRDGSMKEIELTYTVYPENVEKAGEVYNSYGLNNYEAFHDCWENLIFLFKLRYERSHYATEISPRVAFQLFGTEWGRAIDDLIWLKIAPTENVIITDVRFDNEALFFKKLGAKIFKVERDSAIEVAKHVSEAGISSKWVDIYVDNNGSLKDLESIIEYLVEEKYPSGKYTRGFK